MYVLPSRCDFPDNMYSNGSAYRAIGDVLTRHGVGDWKITNYVYNFIQDNNGYANE